MADLHSAAALCLPLIGYLQREPNLDERMAKHLVDARTEISKALNRYYLTSSVVAVKTQSSLRKKEVKRETHNALSSASVAPAELNHDDQKNRENKEQSRRRDQANIGQQRRKKLRAMVAVRSFEQLTLEESNETLLERLLGAKMYKLVWRRKLLFGPLSWMSFAAIVACVFTYIFLPESSSHGWVLMLSCYPGVLWLLIRNAASSNFSLLVRALGTFEVFLFLLEVTLFALGLFGIFCFTLSGALFAMIAVLSICAGFILYDAFPVSMRRAVKYMFLIWSAFVLSVLAIVYFRLPAQMCSYRWNWTEGLKDESIGTTNGKKGNWGFSVLEFGINRGFSVLMLMIRTTVLAFKHPQDCIFLRSRIRIMEVASVGESCARERYDFDSCRHLTPATTAELIAPDLSPTSFASMDPSVPVTLAGRRPG